MPLVPAAPELAGTLPSAPCGRRRAAAFSGWILPAVSSHRPASRSCSRTQLAPERFDCTPFLPKRSHFPGPRLVLSRPLIYQPLRPPNLSASSHTWLCFCPFVFTLFFSFPLFPTLSCFLPYRSLWEMPRLSSTELLFSFLRFRCTSMKAQKFSHIAVSAAF